MHASKSLPIVPFSTENTVVQFFASENITSLAVYYVWTENLHITLNFFAIIIYNIYTFLLRLIHSFSSTYLLFSLSCIFFTTGHINIHLFFSSFYIPTFYIYIKRKTDESFYSLPKGHTTYVGKRGGGRKIENQLNQEEYCSSLFYF